VGHRDCVTEGILFSCAKVTKGIPADGWGQVAQGLRPRLHSVSDGAYRHFCCWSIEELKHYVYLSKFKDTGFCI